MRRPAAAKRRPGRDARGSSDRPRQPGWKALLTSKKTALKGRWTNMSIDPAVHGSPTCGFALRNLHKSPCPYELDPRWTRNGHTSCERVPICSDWCRFRAAGRGMDARPTCGCIAGAPVAASPTGRRGGALVKTRVHWREESQKIGFCGQNERSLEANRPSRPGNPPRQPSRPFDPAAKPQLRMLCSNAWSKLAFSVPTVKACFDHGGRLSVSRAPDRTDSPDARTASDWPGLPGARGARPREPAPPRFSVRRGHVDEIAFRAHFLRFVACVHPISAPFGPSPPTSNHYLLAHRNSDLGFSRTPLPAGTLRASSRRPSLQRTSKNVRELCSRRRVCNEPQKMYTQTERPPPNPRMPAGRGRARPAASRTKPAPIAADWRAATTRTPAAAPARPQPARPGDLWRFRKANLQVDEP